MTNNKKILIVDDEKNFRTILGRTIKEAGMADVTVQEAGSGEEAVAMIKADSPNLVLMDIQMPGTTGLEAFRKLREAQPKLPVVMMTGLGTTETAIESMKLGAFDYITKPLVINQLKDVLRKALDAGSLMEETVTMADTKDTGHAAVRTIVGMSQIMQNIYKTIGQVAGSHVPVLITGESGTGKELVARAIYNYSARKDKPFLAINCSAIPDALLESELFGYEKGAFTGANDRRIGKFEQCNGGTIFLDEIGDMAAPTQAKILRVLQEGEFERVGGQETIKVSVRVISATNRDLPAFIKQGKFREDLFYRLNVVTIQLPSLRERMEDIPDLVRYFLKRFNAEFGKAITEIPQRTMDQLTGYAWPGNVRQLENVIKRAVVVTVGNTLQVEPFTAEPVEIEQPAVPSERPIAKDETWSDVFNRTQEEILRKTMALPAGDPDRENILGKIEEFMIRRTLTVFNGNQLQTAKLLGITRNTLRSRMAQFGLK